MQSEESLYPSKIDWWIGLILFLVPFLHLPLAVLVMIKGKMLFGFFLIFLGLSMAALFAVLCFPCHYALTSNRFRLRSGIINEEIALNRIKEVSESNSVAAAPALSLKRVELKLTDETFRLISPRNRDEFIKEIEAKIEKLDQSQGDGQDQPE